MGVDAAARVAYVEPMAALASTTVLRSLREASLSLPYKQFRRNPYFYLVYDGGWAAGLLVVVGVLLATGWSGLLAQPSWWALALFPLVLYFQILGHVFVHTATHRSWPRSINRIVGEICGAWVITRFASWEIVHQRHHAFSEDPEHDPHPVQPNFWRYAWATLVNVEIQLQRAYYDVYGDTPRNRRYERLRAVVSFATGVLLMLTWYLVWGWFGFFFVFLPAAVLGGLHVIHFNWSTHNGFSPSHDFRPVNLDHGKYWIGNRIFFGIYYHANHHRRPGKFDPRFVTPSLPVEPAS